MDSDTPRLDKIDEDNRHQEACDWERDAQKLIADLERECAELRRDAERYRWLRAKPEMLLHLKSGEFDAAIDAAISAKS